MKTDGCETVMSDKPRRSKSREVSSRFLSPITSSPVQTDAGGVSPLRQKDRASTDSRKNRSDDESGFMQRPLWPASSSKMQSNSNGKIETLADYLGSERLRDDVDRKRNEKSVLISKQKSCSEFGRFESTKESNSKENHKPLFRGSMRYTGKFKFPGRSSTSSSSSSKSSTQDEEPIVPGRFSVDENALRRKSVSRKSDSVSDTQDSESECSDIHSGSSFNSQTAGKSFPASYMSSTASSRSSGIKVASKYTNISNANSVENSPKKFNLKNAMRRTNSLTTTTYGSVKSNWAMSPGRPISPPVTADMKGNTAFFSIHKPPTSPSRAKGVGKLLTKGLDLFKSKKSGVDSIPSPLGPGPSVESVHQLRLMHNRWAQWRYLNARADCVNWNITNQSENNLLYAMDSLTKLQHSVAVKKLQLQKENMEMKLHLVLNSQIKALEAWGGIERPHLTSVSMTAKCLHAVVCRLPLVEGAKADAQLASIRLRRASDIGASLQFIMSELSPTAEKTVSVLSELAEVTAKEKSLLEECLEIFNTIYTLEIEERSLQCNLIQKRLGQQHQHSSKKRFVNNSTYLSM